MTEAEWLSCGDPGLMLDLLRDKTTSRKLRLFAVACCMRVLPAFEHWDLVEAVKRIEAVADQGSHPTDLIGVAHRAEAHLYPEMPREQVRACQAVRHAAYFDESADDASEFEVDDPERSAWPAAVRCYSAVRINSSRQAEYTDLIHCVFGNPFRPAARSPRWLTTTVVCLAEAIYADRAFDRLPILADALEEAGCDSIDILAHSRGPGPHVRGCWVVDLVLGKA